MRVIPLSTQGNLPGELRRWPLKHASGSQAPLPTSSRGPRRDRRSPHLRQEDPAEIAPLPTSIGGPHRDRHSPHLCRGTLKRSPLSPPLLGDPAEIATLPTIRDAGRLGNRGEGWVGGFVRCLFQFYVCSAQ